MKCMAASILLVAVSFQLIGCSTVAKETFGAFRGGKGVYAPIHPVSDDPQANPLGEYTEFELGIFTEDFGGKTPSALMPAFRKAFDEQLMQYGLTDLSGGKTLIIRGRILHYESEDVLGIALGPVEEVVARVELVDAQTGQVLGVANCIGRTTARVNSGVGKKAEGLAKAIVGWIDSRYPPRETKKTSSSINQAIGGSSES